MIKSKDIDIT